MSIQALCRDCFQWQEDAPLSDDGRRCQACGSPRIIAHDELRSLSIAHLDCDAFYASVEKRDDPSLADKPVIVGGGRRGVVSAACYIARIHGVHSAMPMFKARAACPHAVVVRPNMAKYTEVGRQVRDLMRSVTPLVEPLSIDEAFLDLTGTERLHKGPPAETVSRLVARVESELSITISIGLAPNKFLAKIASDLDKPRGFGVVGAKDAMTFLADKPVSIIWGVGARLRDTLGRDGIHRVADLRGFQEAELIRRYGGMGGRLFRFAFGRDDRRVEPEAPTKSVSCETTFNTDLSTADQLQPELWNLCETLSGRLKAKNLAGRAIVLKLKTDAFKLLTRRLSLNDPTQLADTIFANADRLLVRELDGRRYRLLGVGVAELVSGELADPIDLADPDQARRKTIEDAMDVVRAKLGKGAISKGRSLGRD
ncbi:MAG: DNA polymerase IV [Rhodospirillaceae bacterium]|nr:DNA polymerase IV [Rhodospirillaceae bacterium]